MKDQNKSADMLLSISIHLEIHVMQKKGCRTPFARNKRIRITVLKNQAFQ